MKKVIYKKLKVQNFLSIGNEELVIDFANGLNLINGKNIDNPERANAVGKSAIVEAFFFAQFGEMIRKIKKEFIINNITKGKGNLELEFDVESDTGVQTYTVLRQVKPSKVTLLKGDEDITKDSIANTDKFINELIGSNPVICKSCDILSLSDNTPFMAKKPEEKRKFINDIFSLEIFGLMINELKTLIRDNKNNLNISSTKIEEIKNALASIERQKKEYEEKVKERVVILEKKGEGIKERIKNTKGKIGETKVKIGETKDKIKETKGKIKKTKDEISKIEIPDVTDLREEKLKYEGVWVKIDGKIGDINSKISSQNALKNIVKKKIEKASSVDGGVECESCLQEIPHTHIEHLDKVKEEHKEELTTIIEDVEKLEESKADFIDKKGKVQKKVTEIKEEIDEARIKEKEIESLERVLRGYDDSLKGYDESLTGYDESLKGYDESLESYEESLKDLKLDDIPKPDFDKEFKATEKRKDDEEAKCVEYQQLSDDYEVCKFVLSEEGVKSFVVKRLLTILNTSIQEYINSLGMTIRCKFDEYFDEQLTNDKGKEISYWNLSGGERKTIDLACSWSFKDIKRKISGVSSNLEWCDEIFDSAFDERGLDLLIEVIKKRIENNDMSMYAISHRKETVKHIDGEIISLEKENGITRRVFD